MTLKINKTHLITVSGLFLLSLAASVAVYYVKEQFPSLGLVADIIFLALIVTFARSLFRDWHIEEWNIPSRLRLMLILVICTYIASFVLQQLFDPVFVLQTTEGARWLVPDSVMSLLYSGLSSFLIVAYLSFGLTIFKSLIFLKEKRNTSKYFTVLIGLMSLTVLSNYYEPVKLTLEPVGANPITITLYFLTMIAMLVNGFRVSWIASLNRKQKYLILLGVLVFVLLNYNLMRVSITRIANLKDVIHTYSIAGSSYAFIVSLFITVYSLATAINIILHLPTAALYDRKVTEINSMYDLSRNINSVLNFDQIVKTVTKLAIEAISADASWLELRKRDKTDQVLFERVSFKTKTTFDIQLVNKFYELARNTRTKGSSSKTQCDNFYENVLQSEQSLFINNIRRHKLTSWCASPPFNSLIAVPLTAGEETIGLLFAVKRMHFGFDQDDVAALMAFAHQTTIALANERLVHESIEKERLEQELRIAHDMQMQLLPQSIPTVVNESGDLILDIAAFTLPANEVGGDYYDFIQYSDHRLGLIVADVSGKGTSAAFYMAEIKGIIQALTRIYLTPKAILSAANEVLYNTLDSKSFITAIYADVDLVEGRIQFSRAGHCPVLCWQNGKTEYTESRGLGLGLVKGNRFTENLDEFSFNLVANNVYLIYSDGLTEARNIKGEEYGDDRLSSLIERNCESSADEIKSALYADVRAFTQSVKLHDDFTFVVLKVTEHNS